MAILFYLAAIFGFSWLAGFVAVVLLQTAFPVSLYRIRAIRLTLPVVGYAFSNLVWWAGTFLLKLQAGTVMFIETGFAVVALGFLIKRRFSRRLLLPLLPSKRDWPVLIVLCCVLAISAWPYMTVGMGKYFLVNDTDYFNRVTPSILDHNQVPVTHDSQAAYLIAEFPLQISNTMLFQRLIGCTATDCAALQALLDLIFTALGTYWLARYILRLTLAPSVIAAIFSVVAQFYFHTYLDGHIGSMIYASAAPLLFGVAVWALAHNQYRTTLPVIAALWVFMGEAYPLVPYLLVPPFLLGKLRLLYLDKQEVLLTVIWSRLGTGRLSSVTRRVLLVAIAMAVAIPSYQLARTLFYPNRISVMFNGYQPMYLTFDPHVLEWFFGLRLTEGFGYGIVEPSAGGIMAVYDAVATFAAVVLTICVGVACRRLLRSRITSFVSAFLILFPAVAVGMALVWPLSYMVYKALYVHYFLIVIGVVCGFQSLMRITAERRRLVARGLVCVVGLVAGINAFGSCMNGAVALSRVRLFDLADVNTLVGRVKAAGLRKVAILPIHDFSWSLLDYALHQAGITVTNDARVGQPLITPQYNVFRPIGEADICMRSDKGKYVLSNTPNTLVQVYGPAATSPEVRHGVAFRWLNTDIDYTAFQFDRNFRELAGVLRSLPGKPLVYNDFSDSGYYLLVEALLNKYSIGHSDDPRQCLYFIRINRDVRKVVAQMGKGSRVVNRVRDESGVHKVVDQAYLDNGKQVRLWSNDLFDLIFIPMASRQMAAPVGLDVEGLASVIRKDHLVIADDIPPVEYERYYLEDRLRSVGVDLALPTVPPTARLMCLPQFLIEREDRADAQFDGSILWRSSDQFARVQGYRIALLPQAMARRVESDETVRLLQSFHRPLRTVLRRTTVSPLLLVRVFRTDGVLRLLFEAGPSLLGRSFTLQATRVDGEGEPMFFTITAPSQIVRIPVEQFAKAGEQWTDIVFDPIFQFAKRVMPYDDRLLLYRILDCEMVRSDDIGYTEPFKRVLRTSLTGASGQADIVDSSSYQALTLGVGWFQREMESGSPFRWMSDHAELVFESEKTKERCIVISGQVGPSAPSGRISIVTRLNGVPVVSKDVDSRAGRAELVLDFNTPAFRAAFRHGQNVITLSTKGGGRAIPGDPRLLEFRVFHIGFVDSPSFGQMGAAISSLPSPPQTGALGVR